ncbi:MULTISPECIES: GNAT family N-acetyltransferase [unclassified Fibrobacter]|uniref:GNAT family N-acetyltransferase n=1 Tax=Fibrobacter sp. UWH3 TaxID=1964353 RepID=UPI000916938C|nr:MULTISPECIES: GNAT family N-acetyltransferase [unclassified Fibrobacter]OWV05267.1 hypothetical protein B7993_08300 [Fibrobacter sp. UWH3]SHL31073.1 L-amino acid N-acyltransferase YncA [Fibrobacter sp. UWH6]
MLYEAAHFIKDRLKPVWNLVEWGNAQCFALRYRKGLNQIPEILNRHSTDFTVRLATEADAPNLAKFFEEQPEEAFKFFRPHDFDEKSLKNIIRNKAFITFLVLSGETIVGYFFLRSFVNGKSFRGKIVDHRWQGRGIAKLMGKAATDVAQALPVRMFGTISPENYASLASSKAVNEVKILNTLDNGYYYIEYLPKK